MAPVADPHIEPTMGGGFQLTVPKRQAPFLMLFLAVWLVIWWAGEVRALRALPKALGDLLSDSGHSVIVNNGGSFMVALIATWTFLGVWALAALTWLVAGRERLRVEQGTLTLEQMVGPVGRRRRYELRQVTRLRVLPEKEARLGLLLMLTPRLAFDAGSRVVQWGRGVDEAEAPVIVERLAERGVNRAGEGGGVGPTKPVKQSTKATFRKEAR